MKKGCLCANTNDIDAQEQCMKEQEKLLTFIEEIAAWDFGDDDGCGTDIKNTQGVKVMNTNTVTITRSRSGLLCIGVGGGAYTNTFECRYVLRSGALAPTVYVAKSGHLACSLEQAKVVIEVGDIIINLSGRLPFNPEFISIDCQEVLTVSEPIETKEIDPNDSRVSFPQSVIDGLVIYHNRDGRYFVG